MAGKIKNEQMGGLIETNVRTILRDAKTGEIIRIKDHGSNTIVNYGRQSILDRLIQEGNANEGIITYGAVGTDNTVVTVSDTSLGTEIARATIVTNSSRRSAQTATLRVYFAPTEATGSLKEFGWYGGGVDGDPTAAADSGTLYTHILIDETVTDAQSLSVEQDFIW